MRAMKLLKEYGLVFGTSICYTSQNIEAVTNDGFLRMLADNGAHFGSEDADEYGEEPQYPDNVVVLPDDDDRLG